MSAHSFIEINCRLMLGSRESYVPDIAALFTEEELQHDAEHFGYGSTAGELRDRLQLHGYTAARALRDLDAAVAVWRGRHPNPGADAMGVPVKGASDLLAELREYVNSTDEWMHFQLPDDVEWELDPRAHLRLVLDLVDAESPVIYNLESLQDYELLIPGIAIAKQARKARRHAIATDAPLVILTEGSSDSQLLSSGVRVTHPHLVGMLHLMDFTAGAEGSAAALVKLVNSFIGAGMANRVLALVDNDTAAHDALSKLKREELPDSYRILHYPELPLLKHYPTLGPQLEEPVLMDVNGKAGSLEMYLGRELLTVDGELVPVQWMGYMEGQKGYQGAISAAHKKRIQREFQKKVSLALRDPSVRETQDWSGIQAIVKAILEAFD